MPLRVRARAPYQLKLQGFAFADATGLAVVRLDAPATLIGRRAIIARLIASVPITGSGLVTDTFTRTVANGWGTADTGGLWSILGGGAGNFSVNGTEGVIAAGVGTLALALLGVVFKDGTITVKRATGGALNANNVCTPILARVAATNTYYFLQTAESGVNLTSLLLRKNVAGTLTTLSTSAALTLTLPCMFQLVCSGGQLSGYAWNAGAAQPATPTVQAVDLSIVQGGVGIGDADAAGGGSARNYDDLVAAATTTLPTWDAYFGAILPANLRDSSAGQALARWVPNLVNGQPFNAGDALQVVATGAIPGTQVAVTSYLEVA